MPPIIIGSEKMDSFYTDVIQKIADWMPSLIQASGVTLALSVLSVLAGVVLSVFLALGKISHIPVIKQICQAYVFFFRGTPLLMQLFFLYYTLPIIAPALTIKSRFFAAWIAFMMNTAAYLAEIIRAAIQSIDYGQFEASKALGMSYSQTMRYIIIPQAVRTAIPGVGNEFIMVLKDTSLVAMISLTDLTFQTKQIAISSASPLVYIPSMVIYLIFTGVFTAVFNKIEKNFSKYEQNR